MRRCQRSEFSLASLFLIVLSSALGCTSPGAPDDGKGLVSHSDPIEVSISIDREYGNPSVQLWVEVRATNVSDSTFKWNTEGHCVVGFLIEKLTGELVGGGWDCQTVPMAWPFTPGQTREVRGSWDGQAPTGRYYVIGGLIAEGGLAYPDTLILDW